MLKKTFLLLMMFGFYSLVYCDDKSKTLLHEKAALKQAYLLSKNYAYGLTVEKNSFKALAWQYVYVTLLPHAYPGGYALLDPYKEKLDKSKFDEAFELSKEFKREYNLPNRMDENQLIRVFEAKESQVLQKATDETHLTTFDDFLTQLQKTSSETATIYEELWLQSKTNNIEQQFIYGQIIVNGGELEQTLVKNQPLMINKDGFFVASIKQDLFVSAKGYQPYKYDFKSSKEPTSLGVIVLNKYPKKQLASIVGSILPAKKIKSVALTLQFKQQYLDQNNPWLSPTMAVTKLDNGQFYIKGLTPGEYKLILSFNDEKQFVSISVKNGQVKTLKQIQL